MSGLSRLARFLAAVFIHRDAHYARRLLSRASANLRLVLGSLGAHYVRVRPYEDFGGVAPGSACERFRLGPQPAGLLRVNLIAYHLALPAVEGRVVVDAGTNEGMGAALFASRAREVHAFDIAPDAIERARARHRAPNLHFSVHDAETPFPVPDQSVDVVFSSEVIEHLPRGRSFLEAAARALTADGVLLLKTPNLDYNRVENRLNPYHTNPYTARRLRAELARHFEDVRIEGLTYDLALETSVEDRPERDPPEVRPYRFGEPVWIDRVVLVRMRVTPRHENELRGNVPEYLWARARRPRLLSPQEVTALSR